ncbi:MAG: Lrp/AsnC family transcriptional regulator [archaeon]
MLSSKDKQILRELDLDSRQPLSQIARKVRMSKESVNYAIKKLEKQGMIHGYFSLVDYLRLGSNIFKLLVRYKDVGEKGEASMVAWLDKKKEVVWMGKAEGKWDLIISIREKNVENIYKLLEEFNRTFSVHIQEKQLLISYEIEWLNEKYLFDDCKQDYIVKFNQKDEKVEVNNVDNKIIDLLEHNSRTPLVAIASKIGLTAEATAKRIKNLIKKKVIGGFKLRTNHDKLGKGYHHIFISLNDFSKLDEITSYYEKSKRCVFIMKHHGSYDLHLEIVSDSENDFREAIRELREKFGHIIADYQQLTILQEFKLA